MHPLAHMLTGALIGQVTPSPARAFLGGFLSHFVLDIIPHTEEKTFKKGSHSRVVFAEVSIELITGLGTMAWLIRSCSQMHTLTIGFGVLGALFPDLIDFPLETAFHTTLVHLPRLHWTAARRHAVWGILTQLAVVGIAFAGLWRAGGCH